MRKRRRTPRLRYSKADICADDPLIEAWDAVLWLMYEKKQQSHGIPTIH